MSAPPLQQLLSLEDSELIEIADHLQLDTHAKSKQQIALLIHEHLSTASVAGTKRRRERSHSDEGHESRKRTNAPDVAQERSIEDTSKHVTSTATTNDSDDDFGPAIPASLPPLENFTAPAAPVPAKEKELPLEHVYLSALPSAAMYEKSYMHRDHVTHVVITSRADFLVTGSVDGILKFWKKTPGGIEFVKTYKAHAGTIASIAVSADGLRLCSVGDDKTLKLYDVLNFDMVDMVKLPFSPATATWIYRKRSISPLIAISERHENNIHIYNAERLVATDGVDIDAGHALNEDEEVITMSTVAAAPMSEPKPRRQLTAQPVHTLRIHAAPVLCMTYCESLDIVLSADARGMLEYWKASDFSALVSPMVSFTSKFDTDLFDLAKAKTYPQSIDISPNGEMFVVTSTDRKVRLFRLKTGKLERVFPETVETYEALHAAGELDLDALDFGRRMAVEKEIVANSVSAIRSFIAPPAAPDPSKPSVTLKGDDSSKPSVTLRGEHTYRPPASAAIFDDSGYFLMYATPIGIKIVNLVTEKTNVVLGKVESSERFLHMALYQGVPKASTQYNLAREAQDAPIIMSEQGDNKPKVDPTIVVCSYKRNRFYLFSRREPADAATTKEGRDVFNEPPSKEDLISSSEANAAMQRAKLGNQAIIHTNMGDITLKLLPEIAPRAVENFCGHSRSGYFNGLTFHRVIKDFMIQTGDPLGDGTGGNSIWGHPFEDEIDRSTRFDRPGTLAMANAGPCTNGSQFFITTVPCPWLDGKHTIFGRVLKGLDVVKAIENVPTRKDDKPFEDIKIVSVSIK